MISEADIKLDKSGLLNLSTGVGTVTIKISEFFKSEGLLVNDIFLVFNLNKSTSLVASLLFIKSWILFYRYQNQCN